MVLTVPVLCAGDLFLTLKYSNGETIKDSINFDFSVFDTSEGLLIDTFAPTSYFTAMQKLGENSPNGKMLTQNDILVALFPEVSPSKVVHEVAVPDGVELVSKQSYYNEIPGVSFVTKKGVAVYVFKFTNPGRFAIDMAYVNEMLPADPGEALRIEGTAYESLGRVYPYADSEIPAVPTDYASAEHLYNQYGGRYVIGNKCIHILKTTMDSNVKYEYSENQLVENITQKTYTPSRINQDGEDCYIVFSFDVVSAGVLHFSINQKDSTKRISFNYFVENEGDLLAFRERSSISDLIPLDINEAEEFSGGQWVDVKFDGDKIIVLLKADNANNKCTMTTSNGMQYSRVYEDIIKNTTGNVYQADDTTRYHVYVLKVDNTGDFTMTIERTDASNTSASTDVYKFRAVSSEKGITLSDYKKGDVNMDNQINVLDALLALKICAFRYEADSAQLEAADVDGSGNVSAFDALKILQYYSGVVTEF